MRITAATELPSERIRRFLRDEAGRATPYLVVDTELIRKRYRLLTRELPSAACYYSMKASPHRRVLEVLDEEGASFDAASLGEIARCLEVGIPGERLHFGSTIKKATDIAEAHAAGVRSYAFDSGMELAKLAEHAPGARVVARLQTDGIGAAWPLADKFGRNLDQVVELLLAAREAGLDAAGVSFHVGSQQHNPAAFAKVLAEVAGIFTQCAGRGLELRLINLGGGFPAEYRDGSAPITDFADTIRRSVDAYFPNGVELMCEPGRYLVADAGVLRSEVVLVIDDKYGLNYGEARRWVFLDVGQYNGLGECAAIALPMICDREGDVGEVILAGPTCDSTDVINNRGDYRLPDAVTHGDRVTFLGAGGYTTCYATVGFNGFPPPAEYYL